MFICGNFAGVFAQYGEIRIKNYGVCFSKQFADHAEIGALNNYPIMLPYIIGGKMLLWCWGLKNFIYLFLWSVLFVLCSHFACMRSLVPCCQCGTKHCPSGFVFKNVQSKCICKVCYAASNRAKKYNKTSATSEESTTGETPFVLNLNGNFVIIYNIFLIKQFRPALFTLSYLQIVFKFWKYFSWSCCSAITSSCNRSVKNTEVSFILCPFLSFTSFTTLYEERFKK